MHPPSPPPRGPRLRPANTVFGLALAALAVSALAACGSSAGSSGSTGSTGSSANSAAVLGSAKQQDCTAVTDVLADGPDPGSDSVGYAQAQILPLRQLTLSEASLRTAVTNLDAAYQAFSASNGAPADAVKVSTAQDALNALCPGAAP